MNTLLSPRAELRQAMQQRPHDPWPRGLGHVVLAFPGSREDEKSYHEPGGSFSPTVGSCGISIWVTDEAGNILATSDDLPMEDIEQELEWMEEDWALPIIVTRTPFYEARWQRALEDLWLLELKPRDAQTHLTVAVRGAGPAAGPLPSLWQNGDQLYLNERLQIAQPGAKVLLSRESDPDWKTSQAELTRIEDADGWCCARIVLPPGGESHTLQIFDIAPHTHPHLDGEPVRAEIEIELPDARFVACLQAQIAHLMMGLVRDETRPGEPVNYPLNWQRDGAYVIASLARAGLDDAARILAAPYAEIDFFGGFGSEADAPGLALWAMHETARALPAPAQPAYEEELWPHVYRKAELIRAMRETRAPLRVPPYGPIVPEHARSDDLDLVCEPAIDGLINGRMDWHRPLIYINAVSFAGLRFAATFAARQGQNALADSWNEEADAIQSAWIAALDSDWADNERAAICGLWPSNVAAPVRERYRELLRKRAQSTWAEGAPIEWPLWTYFHFAEAHQWLLLDESERAWTTLEWFWKHQASPGLWTWWEGNREENSFGGWEKVRGWADPRHVTPHYWTASELLALMLDMLVFRDDSGDQAALVVGAGVREEWLSSPLRVANLPMDGGFVDWQWHPTERVLEVWLSDLPSDLPVRAAVVFGDAHLRLHLPQD